MQSHLPCNVLIHTGPFAGQTGVLEGLERRGGVRIRVNEVCSVRVDAGEIRQASPSAPKIARSRPSERVSSTRTAPSVLPSCAAISFDGKPST
jgi:hypothetical protein